MDFMVCATGEPGQLDYVPLLESLGAGIELQGYGLVGASSPEAWEERFEKHRAFRKRYRGSLAIHGPFIGISYAFFDHLLLEAMRERMRLIYAVAEELRPRRLVLHTGFKPEVLLFSIEEMWMDGTVAFWRSEIGKYAEIGVEVVLENLIEADPGFMIRLHDEVGHESFKLCLDVGHVNVYSELPSSEWIDRLGARLTHVHLHDNRGEEDEHLPVGSGNLDFDAIFESLRRVVPQVTVSLEVDAERERVLSNLREVVERYGG